MTASVDLLAALAGDTFRRAKGFVLPRRIVTLHHLACSGGTIVTKALAAMPKTMVLSEIHPDRAAQPAFHPHMQIRRGYEDQLTDAHRAAFRGHFRREIVLAHSIAKSLGNTLVVRDHAHVDFVWRGNTQSMLLKELSGHFQITPIVTIRDPREVWLSVRREGWFDGTPDELCRAHCNLLDAFPDASVFRYEDLAEDPKAAMRAICDASRIAFDPEFQSRLDTVMHLTGDSGRKSNQIAPRPPKPLSQDDAAAFAQSAAFAELRERMGYKNA